jgi:dTDP-4-amino-4,6-dideoxygalactose transaminase
LVARRAGFIIHEDQGGGHRFVIPIAMPFLEKAEAEAAYEAVLSGWVSQGPQVAAFERDFATAVGAPHACAVSNCTTALHLALLAAGVGPGDEVITASHSFIATANSIRYCGATPVFVDIDPATYNIDPACVAEAVTGRTRAILAIHQMGMPCDLPALMAVASRHDIALIEDAACAAGSQIRIDGQWESIGRPRGRIACFSFHPRKVITTGEGGMLTTRDPELDRKFRLCRQHGMSIPDTVRHGSSEVIFEDYLLVGFNYRMTDIQAAIGRKQLERLSSIISSRRALAALYAEVLQGVEGLQLPREPEWARSNWQSYCVRLADWADQRSVMQGLLSEGIATRRGVMCSHREPPYSGEERRFNLRQSELAQDHSILLPIYQQMTKDDVIRVAVALRHELKQVRDRPERGPTVGSVTNRRRAYSRCSEA